MAEETGIPLVIRVARGLVFISQPRIWVHLASHLGLSYENPPTLFLLDIELEVPIMFLALQNSLNPEL